MESRKFYLSAQRIGFDRIPAPPCSAARGCGSAFDVHGTLELILSAAGVSLRLSVLLLVLFGFARFGDPDHAVWGLGFYAILTLAFANLRPRWQALVWSASGLTLIALLQALVFRWQPPEEWPYSCLLALLLHSLLFSIIAASRMTRGAVRVESAWTTNAVLTTAAALGLMIILAAAGRQPVAPELLLAAAGNLLLIAWSIQSRGMFAAFQATLLLAATFAVHDACAAQAWSAEAFNVWLHPATLQWLALAWSVYGLTWMVVRWFVLRWLAQPERQVEPRRLALLSLLFTDSHTDRAAVAAALTVSVLVCAYSVVPGVAQELAPRGLYPIASDPALAARQAPSADQFELRGIPHGPAAGVASWLALLGLGATLSIGLRMRWSAWKLFGVALVLLAVAFLLAGRWESQVACALGAAFGRWPAISRSPLSCCGSSWFGDVAARSTLRTRSRGKASR